MWNPMPFKDNIFLDCLRKHHFHICRGNHRQKEEGGFLLLILFNFVPFFLFFFTDIWCQFKWKLFIFFCKTVQKKFQWIMKQTHNYKQKVSLALPLNEKYLITGYALNLCVILCSVLHKNSKKVFFPPTNEP